MGPAALYKSNVGAEVGRGDGFGVGGTLGLEGAKVGTTVGFADGLTVTGAKESFVGLVVG